MKTKIDEIVIDGQTYVPKSSLTKAETLDGMDYVIVRTYSAGVFAGYLEKRDGQEVILRKARRIWYWSGAASLSQLSIDGSNDQENCKYPEAVDKVELTQAIEVLYCTEKARLNIQETKIWKN